MRKFSACALVLALISLVTYSQVSTLPPGSVKATNVNAPVTAQMPSVGGIVTNTSGLLTQVTAGNVYCTGGRGSFPLSKFTMLANQTYLIVYNCARNAVYAKTAVTGPGSSGTTTPGIPNTYLAPIPNVEVGIAQVVCGASTCATLTDKRIPAQWVTSGSPGTGAAVASATTTLLTSNTVQHITGTTTITTLNTCDATTSGVKVVLIFDGILTLTDGNNLKMAGNFVTTADDTIDLVCDGTNWYETARSVN